jgi:hypothetical protein
VLFWHWLTTCRECGFSRYAHLDPWPVTSCTRFRRAWWPQKWHVATGRHRKPPPPRRDAPAWTVRLTGIRIGAAAVLSGQAPAELRPAPALAALPAPDRAHTSLQNGCYLCAYYPGHCPCGCHVPGFSYVPETPAGMTDIDLPAIAESVTRWQV